MEGWFKLNRGITEWEWFTDGNTLKLWIYLLAKANYKDSHYKGIEVKRGQLVTGRKKLAEALGMSEKQIRTSLAKLEKTGEVAIKRANKYSIISIVKYGFYQDSDDEKGQQNGQQRANKGPTKGHNLINKERKEGKNIFNSLPIYDPSRNENVSEELENELLELMKGRA